MNSRTFSSGVSGCGFAMVAVGHSPGNVPPPLPPVLTWKSLKRTRPHCCAAVPNGCVLNVNSSGLLVP